MNILAIDIGGTMVKYGLKQSQENIGKIKLRIIQTDSINLNLIWGQDYE